MPYYLRHTFDPDFDYQSLAPQMQKDGSVDHHTLSYVQNVVKGQVLAHWEDVGDEDLSSFDPRFIYPEKKFPVGHNCKVHPANSNQLVASADGYVFYLQGKINVKKVLNIRRDVDFHTGDITFVGDVIVHGTVRSGFAVRAKDIRVYGNINGATIRAKGDLVVDGGIKGGKCADIQARGTIRAGFCENAELRSGKDIILEGVSHHSVLYAPRLIAIKGRLQGGRLYSGSTVIVKGRAGCGLGGKTSVILGFDVGLYQEAKRVKAEILRYKDARTVLLEQNTADSEQVEKEKRITEKLEALQAHQFKVWEDLEGTFNPGARLLISEEILPGLEVSIGPAYLRVNENMCDVGFHFKNNEILPLSPALSAAPA